VHASMARAIHPFHALVDGDVLFAVTTNELESPLLEPIALGVVASELAWDAVLRAVEVGERRR
jgi:L-aminopeptidase/D-esterase-like protein